MGHETRAARMERLLRTLPPAVRGMGFGDPDDAEYAHASDVVAWAIREIDRIRELLQDSLIEIVCLRAEIDRLREERRWIPVGERLPEDNVAVLVNHDSGGVEMAYLKDGLWCISWTGFKHSGVAYTHWQPLPAPPKGGEVE